MLRELVQRGVRLAVASNKFQIGTEKLSLIHICIAIYASRFGDKVKYYDRPTEEIERLKQLERGAKRFPAKRSG